MFPTHFPFQFLRFDAARQCVGAGIANAACQIISAKTAVHSGKAQLSPKFIPYTVLKTFWHSVSPICRLVLPGGAASIPLYTYYQPIEYFISHRGSSIRSTDARGKKRFSRTPKRIPLPNGAGFLPECRVSAKRSCG
uniref:Uncharacterized protein n=1 Tax=Anopheles melas TaxID=34690 RepID=A0A182UK17_9DIPT